VSKNFQLAIASRPDAAPRDNLGALSLPTPPRPATQLLYKRARYPYFGVGRLQAKTSDLDFARRVSLPSSPKQDEEAALQKVQSVMHMQF